MFCKEKGLLSCSLSPNPRQRSVFFAPHPVALPSLLLRGIFPQPPAQSAMRSQRLPGHKAPCCGQEWGKKQRKNLTLSPSFSPFPKTKDCKYCVSCLLHPASPQCPSLAIKSWHGMQCGREGRRKAPNFPARICGCSWDASSKEALVR